jgi:hypothetical protein
MGKDQEFFRGTIPAGVGTYWHEVDGKLVEMTPEELAEAQAQGKIEHDLFVKAAGHDCWDDTRHDLDERGQDYYYCGVCGFVTQYG